MKTELSARGVRSGIRGLALSLCVLLLSLGDVHAQVFDGRFWSSGFTVQATSLTDGETHVVEATPLFFDIFEWVQQSGAPLVWDDRVYDGASTFPLSYSLASGASWTIGEMENSALSGSGGYHLAPQPGLNLAVSAIEGWFLLTVQPRSVVTITTDVGLALSVQGTTEGIYSRSGQWALFLDNGSVREWKELLVNSYTAESIQRTETLAIAWTNTTDLPVQLQLYVHGGASASVTIPPAVPEPAGASMLLAGLVVLIPALCKRRPPCLRRPS